MSTRNNQSSWTWLPRIIAMTLFLMGGMSSTAAAFAPPEENPTIECVFSDEGHALCEKELGFPSFCSKDGICVIGEACEALDCCQPGSQGDAWCVEIYGEESACEVVQNWGQCTPSGATSVAPQRTQCQTDEECGCMGECLEDGSCVYLDMVPADQCATDSDCPENTQCVLDPLCNVTVCEAVVCPSVEPECLEDSDCGPNMACLEVPNDPCGNAYCGTKEQEPVIALCMETGGSWTSCGSDCGPITCENPELPEICTSGCTAQCICPPDFVWSDTGCLPAETCEGIPLDPEQALCILTGGSWETQSCGDYECGQPPSCEAIIPGCNCGEGMNFTLEGCGADAACEEEETGGEETGGEETGGDETGGDETGGDETGGEETEGEPVTPATGEETGGQHCSEQGTGGCSAGNGANVGIPFMMMMVGFLISLRRRESHTH